MLQLDGQSPCLLFVRVVNIPVIQIFVTENVGGRKEVRCQRKKVYRRQSKMKEERGEGEKVRYKKGEKRCERK